MARQGECMEVGGVEDADSKFLQDAVNFDDSLDLSANSIQGSVTVPTFAMGQSYDLHGSHGFQISNLNFSVKNEEQNSSILLNTGKNYAECNKPETAFVAAAGMSHMNPGLALQSGTLILQGSPFGALNVIQAPEQYQVVLPNDICDLNSGQPMGVTVTKPEVIESSVLSNEVFEGGSSDEKSGKYKTSPKRRGRKSRSTSSTGNEMAIKCEAVPGPSPCRIDSSDQQQFSTDMGFKPSLLEEILTDKKMALLKSPEVVKFLQQQQQQQVKEKILAQKQETSS